MKKFKNIPETTLSNATGSGLAFVGVGIFLL